MYVQNASVTCPYCGAVFDMTIDTSQGSTEFIEDCSVCCRPIAIEVDCQPGEVLDIRADRA